jgi:hypothetical protein
LADHQEAIRFFRLFTAASIVKTDFILLDLDGVLVLEAAAAAMPELELLLLHRNLGIRAAGFGQPIIVLTHRSRREAQQILRVAGLSEPVLTGIIAAEDLMIAGLRFAPLSMLRRGLRKDLALPIIERKFGADRKRLAFIDDRPDNLEDMLAAGIGLAMHAPSSINFGNGTIESFDLDYAVATFLAWNRNLPRSRPLMLPSRSYPLEVWRRTGLSTTKQSRHLFNSLRSFARTSRVALSRRPRNP